MEARDFAAENGADDAIDVFDWQFCDHLVFAFQRELAELEEGRVIERSFQPVVLGNLAVASHFRTNFRLIKNPAEVEAACFPVIDGFLRFETIGASDHFVHGAETELRHEFANFLRDKSHEVDGMGRITGEILAKLGILGRNADRTRVEMTDAHHDATERHEWSGRKTKLFRAKERRDNHIATGLELAVGFHSDTTAQIVQNERLVGLSQAQLPWNSCVLDAGLR